MSPKLLTIVKREYLQQVRTKAFWIATLLIPTIGLAIVFVQVLMAKSLVAKGKIGVVDLSGRLYEPLVAEVAAKAKAEAAPAAGTVAEEIEKKIPEAGAPKRPNLPTALELFRVEATPETLPDVRRRLNEDVQKERIKAYIVLTEKTLETGAAEWRAQSVKADLVMRERIEEHLSRAATKERLKALGVDPGVFEKARVKAKLDPREAKEVETAVSKNEGFNLAVSAVFFFLIYMSLFIYGAYIIRGVLEEKNNRIVEVLVSSVRPRDLMLGKIIGIGLVGLTQYAVWAVLAVGLSMPAVLAMVGLTEGLPAIPIVTIVAFVVFFLLGYFFYAGIYAAFAAPFNTEQEAQQFVSIPTMILVMTSVTWFYAYNSPNGMLSQVLSLIPFTSPLMMFMRISVQTPPLWQIALSVSLLLVSIWGVAWFAGRVYRVGILMYGKKPTLPEIFRWAFQTAD